MLSGLDHLVVTVTDVGRAVDFYSRVLGLDVRYRDAQRVDLMLGETALRLHQTDTDIAPISATPTPGSLDLCLRCRLPLTEFQQHLEALGVEIEATTSGKFCPPSASDTPIPFQPPST